MKTISTAKRKVTGFVLRMKALFRSLGIWLYAFFMERIFIVNSLTDIIRIGISRHRITFTHKRIIVRIRYRYRFAPFPGKLVFWFQGNR